MDIPEGRIRADSLDIDFNQGSTYLKRATKC